MNVRGVFKESTVKMINDRVNHLHAFNEVNLYYSIKDNFCYCLGICINTSSTQFKCQCNPGYESLRCEKTVNFCANITCQNRGVCFQQLLNYTCHCLEGFSGRYCEIIGTSAVVRAYVSKGKFIGIDFSLFSNSFFLFI